MDCGLVLGKCGRKQGQKGNLSQSLESSRREIIHPVVGPRQGRT